MREQNVSLNTRFRDLSDKHLTQTSLVEQHEADSLKARARLEELSHAQDQHVRTIDQIRVALQAATMRAQEVDVQYSQSREQITQLESEVAELRGELEARGDSGLSAEYRSFSLEGGRVSTLLPLL